MIDSNMRSLIFNLSGFLSRQADPALLPIYSNDFVSLVAVADHEIKRTQLFDNCIAIKQKAFALHTVHWDFNILLLQCDEKF